MYINEQYHHLAPVSEISHQYIGRNGIRRNVTEEVLSEHLLEVWINDRLTMRLVCLGEYLTELLLGRLFTEGMISGADDVEQIYICEYGTRARVVLRDFHTTSDSVEITPANEKTIHTNTTPITAETAFIEITPTCCTGNHILNHAFVQNASLRPVTPVSWRPEWIFHLADTFAAGTPLHQKTCATHSCFLARQDQILFQCEDIGRHNALDKAIGYGLRQEIPLTECILYSSGRIPTDMMEKVIRAGIPVLASKAAPTAEAVQLAKQYHVALICAARRDRMKVYAP